MAHWLVSAPEAGPVAMSTSVQTPDGVSNQGKATKRTIPDQREVTTAAVNPEYHTVCRLSPKRPAFISTDSYKACPSARGYYTRPIASAGS
jgi:hypothetical protein